MAKYHYQGKGKPGIDGKSLYTSAGLNRWLLVPEVRGSLQVFVLVDIEIKSDIRGEIMYRTCRTDDAKMMLEVEDNKKINK